MKKGHYYTNRKKSNNRRKNDRITGAYRRARLKKQKRIRRIKQLGLVLAIAAVLILVFPGQFSNPASYFSNISIPSIFHLTNQAEDQQGLNGQTANTGLAGAGQTGAGQAGANQQGQADAQGAQGQTVEAASPVDEAALLAQNIDTQITELQNQNEQNQNIQTAANQSQTEDDKLTVDKIKASYVVVDVNTGKVLASNKANRRVYPASTTKVLAMVTVIDKMKQLGISMDDYVKVTKKMMRSVPYGSKCAYLGVKKRYRYKDILGLVIVCSAADAVKVLEISLFGNEKNFTKAMNEKAKAIGMKKSYFDNGIGVDRSNGYKKIHTTAADMAKIAFYAARNYPEINNYAKKKYIKVKDKSGKIVHIQRSTNQFYRTVKYNKKNYRVVGMKTGFTNLAGSTLLTRAIGKNANNEGRNLVVAVFHVKGNENVYQDTKLLLDQYMK